MLSSLSQSLLSVRRFYRRLTVVGGLLSVLIVLAVWWQPFVAVEYITRDPAAIANHPIYYGALSNLGVLLWMASATACLVGALVAKTLSARGEIVGFFSGFAGLSAMLCMDDLFLIHEEILPNKLGISENVLFVFYAIALLFLLLRFRKILLRTQPILLALSLCLFSMSMSSDLIPALASLPRDNTFALEDGSKFVAIFAWFSYFLWIAVEKIVLLANDVVTRSNNASTAMSSESQKTLVSSSVK